MKNLKKRSTFTILLSAILSAIAFPVLGFPASVSNFGLEKRNVNIELPQTFSNPDITQVITFKPRYSTEHNVQQNPFSSGGRAQQEESLRRKVDSQTEEETESREPEDDRDMYMEPMEPMEQDKKETRANGARPTSQTLASVEPISTQKDNHQMGQHFFPSFAPVFSLGHSRPHQLFHQEPFFNAKARVASTIATDYNPFQSFRETSYKVPLNFEDDAISTNILGSGNFGVLRGGTYYNEEDEYRNIFSPHFTNNGHGRPYYSNPRPQKYINGDFFANFRDFAEINTPTKASYSQYVVVYISGNGTKSKESGKDVAGSPSSQPVTPISITRPKNIFEQLTLLDQNDESFNYDQMDDSEEHLKEDEKKKISLHKRKLALLSQEKLQKEKSYSKNKDPEKEFLEPLLALS